VGELIKKPIVRLASLYLLVGLFFVFFNPNNLPLILFIVPFILVFILIYQTAKLVVKTFFSLKPQQERIVLLVVSVMPVIMLVIQSITQLTVRDVILCLAITTILVWYGVRINAEVS
jgi:hypothetical protein